MGKGGVEEAGVNACRHRVGNVGRADWVEGRKPEDGGNIGVGVR